MFKGVLFAAAALSAIGCLAYDINARVDLANTRREVELRETELHKYAGIDREVLAFQRQKGALQKRIDLINEVKQVQSTTADAMAMLNQLGSEASAIESVSATDAKKSVVHGRAQSQKLIDDVASRLGLKVTYEAKP